MTRLLFLAAACLGLAGCRHSCGNTASLFNRGCNTSQATPVSFNTAPAMGMPASYSAPVGTTMTALPAGAYPMIPPPPNATELPMPTETIPPTVLPTIPVVAPNGRSVGMPK